MHLTSFWARTLPAGHIVHKGSIFRGGGGSMHRCIKGLRIGAAVVFFNEKTDYQTWTLVKAKGHLIFDPIHS